MIIGPAGRWSRKFQICLARAWAYIARFPGRAAEARAENLVKQIAFLVGTPSGQTKPLSFALLTWMATA